MRAVGARLRADFRRRWWSWVGLGLAIGLAGAVVLVAAAGARRTQTAFPRFLKASQAEDDYIAFGTPIDPQASKVMDGLDRLPQVVGKARVAAVVIVPGDGTLPAPYHFAGVDSSYGNTIDRPNLIAGRRPDPARADEVLVNRAMAQQRHLHVGSTLDWYVLKSPDQLTDSLQLSDIPKIGERVHLRVVGIGVYPNEVIPTAEYDSNAYLYLTPAFLHAHEASVQGYGFYLYRFRHGDADINAFNTAGNALLAKAGQPAGEALGAGRAERNSQVERAIAPQAFALALFAALAAATFLLVISQVIGRQIYVGSTDYGPLRALGMSRRQLFVTPLIRVTIVAVAGGIVAVVVAALASPLMPIGPAGLAEPHPGFTVNVAMLGSGFALLILLVVGFAAIPAWRAVGVVGDQLTATAQVGRARRPLPLGTLAGAGFPVTSLIGIRAALQSGRGRTSVPVRGALVTAGLAIAAVVAAVTFTGNLNRLVSTPDLYGWNWDLRAGIGFFGRDIPKAVEELEHDPAVAAVAPANAGDVVIHGRFVAAMSIDASQHAIGPTLLEGRAPEKDDEIALGTRTLRRDHLSIGDRLVVNVGGVNRSMRVVGRAVFPKMGAGSFDQTDLGEGAAVTPRALAGPDNPDQLYTYLLIKLRPDADRVAAESRLSKQLLPLDVCGGNLSCAIGPQPPGTIGNYRRIRSTPVLLSAALAVMAIGALGHVLVSSVRRRRRDLATYKTLGFVRAQVSAVTAWQATTMALVALLIGVPVGIVLGRLAWVVFANQLGVASAATTPVLAVLLAIPATIVLANLIAAGPAIMAARTPPAVLQRAE